jgi:hypothetical protein
MIGLAGVIIKSHGGADRVAFANAVRVAVVEARKGVPAQIGALVQELAQLEAAAQRPRPTRASSFRRMAATIRPSAHQLPLFIATPCHPLHEPTPLAFKLRRQFRSSRPRLARQQGLTKCAELLVGIELVAQLAKHELDHDRIV